MIMQEPLVNEMAISCGTQNQQDLAAIQPLGQILNENIINSFVYTCH